MKRSKDEQEIETLYEAGRITTRKPGKAMLKRAGRGSLPEAPLIPAKDRGKQRIDPTVIAAAIRADRDAR
jgi:hypothetical protein